MRESLGGVALAAARMCGYGRELSELGFGEFTNRKLINATGRATVQATTIVEWAEGARPNPRAIPPGSGSLASPGRRQARVGVVLKEAQ